MTKMPVNTHRFIVSCLLWLSVLQTCAGQKRGATVADSIGATWFGTPLEDALNVPPPIFSPSGDSFVVLTRKGLLPSNANRYTLTFFRMDEIPHGAAAHHLLEMDSNTTDPAIDQVRWLPQGDSLTFLGERPGETRQIYSFDLRSQKLIQLSHSLTNVDAYAVTADQHTVVFLCKSRSEPETDAQKSSPIIVSGQTIPSLLGGGPDSGALQHYRLFVEQRDRVREIPIGQDFVQLENGLTISPDGRYATVAFLAEKRPEAWSQYRFPTWMRWIVRHELIDIESGRVQPLLDAPSSAWRPELAWEAQSQSVVIASTYLPLDGTAQRLGVPETKEIAVEVRLSDRRISLIADDSYHLLKWDSHANQLVLGDGKDQPILFSLRGEKWEQIGKWNDPVAERQSFTIQREAGIHQPDRLVAIEKTTGRKQVIFDPNPQFASLRFGDVQEIQWKTADGHSARGGLYFPANYQQGIRYPLVIQTHGWSNRRFWIDGPSSAGYAAQALAGKGFVVAQVDGITDASGWQSTPKEGPIQMSMIDGLIDDLDTKGLIDPHHVGIVGWSRSGYLTRYALEFSKHVFGAAVIADGYDDGYFHYLTRLTLGRAEAEEYEHMIGAAPFGLGIETWQERSTGFNLDRVHTPVRLLGFSPTSLLSNWEWYAGLQYLKKPVEFVWMPDAGHAPILPVDRLTAQDGDVDWFTFWLIGREDPNPQKQEQYRRWRALRSLNDASVK